MPPALLNCSSLMDVCLKDIWKYPFVLEAEEDFQSTFPSIGDTRPACSMLVSQESASLFGRYELCGGLTKQNGRNAQRCLVYCYCTASAAMLEWLWFSLYVCCKLMWQTWCKKIYIWHSHCFADCLEYARI